jgi:hypothetical protein
VFGYAGVRTGPSPTAKSSFKKFMVTITNASLWSDLEVQREQELAEARAIQIGMPPQGALRTAQRNRAIGTRRLGNFSERWILRGAEFRGRILWHGKRTGGVRKLAGKFAQGDSATTDGAAVSYSCGRP